MAKFELKKENSGGKLVIHLSGMIDEDADFHGCPLAGASNLEIDLVNVKGINSCGIREWIKWMEPVAAVPVELKSCPKVIIDQINMVDGFLPPKGKIQSFYVPYFSEGSGEEKSVLFSLGKEFKDGQLSPPSTIKDSEGNMMEMDVIESKYFKFLKKVA